MVYWKWDDNTLVVLIAILSPESAPLFKKGVKSGRSHGQNRIFKIYCRCQQPCGVSLAPPVLLGFWNAGTQRTSPRLLTSRIKSLPFRAPTDKKNGNAEWTWWGELTTYWLISAWHGHWCYCIIDYPIYDRVYTQGHVRKKIYTVFETCPPANSLVSSFKKRHHRKPKTILSQLVELFLVLPGLFGTSALGLETFGTKLGGKFQEEAPWHWSFLDFFPMLGRESASFCRFGAFFLVSEHDLSGGSSLFFVAAGMVVESLQNLGGKPGFRATANRWRSGSLRSVTKPCLSSVRPRSIISFWVLGLFMVIFYFPTIETIIFGIWCFIFFQVS